MLRLVGVAVAVVHETTCWNPDHESRAAIGLEKTIATCVRNPSMAWEGTVIRITSVIFT